MPRYIEAVKAAEIIAERTKYNMVDLVDWFCEIASEDVQPVVHAEWIKVYKDRLGNEIYRCSKCDFSYMHNETLNYCPSCGAKMYSES